MLIKIIKKLLEVYVIGYTSTEDRSGLYNIVVTDDVDTN